MTNQSPFNAIPPVVVILSVLVLGLEAIFYFSSAGMFGGEARGWRLQALTSSYFSVEIWEATVGQGQWSFDLAKRYFTYAFVHYSFTGAVFAGAMLLALGKFVGELYHWAAVVAIVFASILAGSVAFGLLAPPVGALLGMFPGVYGLIGAFTYVQWLRLGQIGQNQLQAFRLIGILLIFQLVFGLLSAVFGSAPNYGWIADLAGFVMGLVMAPFVAPGGWAAFLHRMRNR